MGDLFSAAVSFWFGSGDKVFFDAGAAGARQGASERADGDFGEVLGRSEVVRGLSV